MSAAYQLKRANEVLDYPFDWSQMMQASETIETVVTTVEPVEIGGLVVDSGGDAVSDIATIVVPFLSGGIAGRRYVVENTIVTNKGRTDSQRRTILIGA